MRGNDHWTPTQQTTSPLRRDDWKARTRTEGDSKAPSASIASSTCRKAGAQGKHTRSVVNDTGERKRGREEKSLGREQGNRPEERTRLQDSASNARHRQSRGRATPQAERGATRQEVALQRLFQNPRSVDDPKGKGKRKKESPAPEPPLHLANMVRRRRGRRAIPSGEKLKGDRPLRSRSRRHRQHPRSRSFRKEKQGWRRV